MANLHSTKSNRLPSKGQSGDAYFATDTKQFFIAIADGTLLNLSDLLSGACTVRVVGPAGETGQRGDKGDKGERGERGEKGTPGNDGQQGPKGDKGTDGIPGSDGKDGRDGNDSTVPGPRGEAGIAGPRGEKGEPGDITIVGDAELQAAVVKLKAQKAAGLASIAAKLEAMGSHPVYRIAKLHLEDVKKELA